ncbi:MAG: RNA-binding transcriptional accessory protein, partial [Planctomycetales bacterium]
MDTTIQIDLNKIAGKLGIRSQQAHKVCELLDAQNTVPFITRYRKDQTGGLDEEQIRAVQEQISQQRQLTERKQTILRSIQSQGKLTDQLVEKIYAAETSRVLEDLYLPFKPKKQTLATAARERGLDPLAQEILRADPMCSDLDARSKDFIDPDGKIVPTGADALLGAGHIISESISERADLRGELRKILQATGKLSAAKVEGKDSDRAKEYQDYFEYGERLDKIPPHRVLAINRGQRDKVLRIKVEADSVGMHRVLDQYVVPEGHEHGEFIQGCGRDALARLILPGLEREIRRELTEKAENHAVRVFARNLRNLLLQPPVKGRRVLAVDPGFRNGCKLAAIDEFGNVLDHGVVFIVGKDERKKQARAKMVEWARKHQLNVVAIGNGTACRETEEIVAEFIADELSDLDVSYVIVNEAGASVYSTSPLGREELPDFDPTTRGTLSIGRRLQDPLSELVKISPQHLGVGLYQHDLKEKHLQQSLDEVVESCVNYVGVDLNMASVALLRYVSGFNQLIARRLVEHRVQNGPFKTRKEIQDVSGVGDATFTHAAGFLKISDGDNPLDATGIHPESYSAATGLLTELGYDPAALRDRAQTAEAGEKLKQVDLQAISDKLEVGQLTLRDIIADLSRPGRDPREDLPPPIFKKGILRLEDLSEGMELTGTVLNVVDFGAFVDIGLKDSGLVHVSELSENFVRNSHEAVALGDVVTVWVLGVDKERRRVSLTRIDPARREEVEAQRQKARSRHKKPDRQPG